jgi:hypothetical protein
LILRNHSETLRGVFLEGVLIGWLRPHQTWQLADLTPGSYQLGWASFLGDQPVEQSRVAVPGRAQLGVAAPDGGLEPGPE